MENNLSQHIDSTAQPAMAEEKIGATDLVDNEQLNLGKFKDVNSLLNAYNSLEAEFTRRSQRLKELEGAKKCENNEANAKFLSTDLQTENLSNSDNKNLSSKEKNDIYNLLGKEKNDDLLNSLDDKNADAENINLHNTAEGKNVSIEQVFENEVFDFLNKYPEASKFSGEIARAAATNKNYDKGFLEKAYINVLNNSVSKFNNLSTDENELYSLISSNNIVKDKIIKDYLNNLSKNNSVKLLSNLGNGVVMPPSKPKTISEAGILAQTILKKL